METAGIENMFLISRSIKGRKGVKGIVGVKEATLYSGASLVAAPNYYGWL